MKLHKNEIRYNHTKRRYCVYALKHKNRIVYIGMTICLPVRIAAHKSYHERKNFDEVTYIRVKSENAAVELETRLMLKHRPKYNRELPGKRRTHKKHALQDHDRRD